jgi:hypothetical protein
VQLVQIERAVAGERPYRDFETSYTPAYFAAYAALWRATGYDLVATRTAQVVLHAAVVAAGFALARLWAEPRWRLPRRCSRSPSSTRSRSGSARRSTCPTGLARERGGARGAGSGRGRWRRRTIARTPTHATARS